MNFELNKNTLLTVLHMQQHVFGTDNHYIQDEGRGHGILFDSRLGYEFPPGLRQFLLKRAFNKDDTVVSLDDVNFNKCHKRFRQVRSHKWVCSFAKTYAKAQRTAAIKIFQCMQNSSHHS